MQATPPARRFGPCMQQESSCTTPSAFGNPPYPTLSSSGSSSTMFTPAMSASSTSAPSCVISVNAFWTQVMSPPFLNLFPFADAITTGLAVLELVTVGAWPKSARGVTANVNPPATLDCIKRRLFMLHPSTATGSMAILTVRQWTRDRRSLVGNLLAILENIPPRDTAKRRISNIPGVTREGYEKILLYQSIHRVCLPAARGRFA